jgi:hypothetical protein
LRPGRRVDADAVVGRDLTAEIELLAPSAERIGRRFTAGGATPPHIVRDFQDPYLKLVRLVREASETEHALLVQYLYASLSVKSRYQALIGTGGDDSISLVG